MNTYEVVWVCVVDAADAAQALDRARELTGIRADWHPVSVEHLEV